MRLFIEPNLLFFFKAAVVFQWFEKKKKNDKKVIFLYNSIIKVREINFFNCKSANFDDTIGQFYNVYEVFYTIVQILE